MKIKSIRSGIQRKYLRYTFFLLLLALLLSGVGCWGYLYTMQRNAFIEQYKSVDEKMGVLLENLYAESDDVTSEFIFNEDVQQSLRSQPSEEQEMRVVQEYLAYLELEYVDEYCYIDNGKNVYTRPFINMEYEAFEKSGFQELLGDSYAKMKWIWTEDTLFSTGKEALFICRPVHSMEYAHSPGFLFLKMEDRFLKEIFGDDKYPAGDAAIGILDGNGQVFLTEFPEFYEMPEADRKRIRELSNRKDAGMIVSGDEIDSGILLAYRQETSGFVVFTVVPDQILMEGQVQLLQLLTGIYLLVAAVVVIVSVYFSKQFTMPIQSISETMSNFDGKDFSRTIRLNTNTELDQIGKSYNKMVQNIERLIGEVKVQEQKLRTSEMKMLISQINPHFLYNTLDTIYMLARINGEETTMKMIQALSKYLRLSLSKGNDIVTVEEELENVKNYMEIQQIRNQNLFRYKIYCEKDLRRRWILKLILQPLVENSIKYGFCEIFEGGLIQIEIKEESGKLVFVVFNSGKPIEHEIAEKVNGLNGKGIASVEACFSDRDHGYGLTSVITRLRLKYGEDVQFYYEEEENGTRCIIRIPDNGEENKEL